MKIVKKLIEENPPPQGLSEASNSAGMRREKNPQAFFDLPNLKRDEAWRGRLPFSFLGDWSAAGTPLRGGGFSRNRGYGGFNPHHHVGKDSIFKRKSF